MKKKLLSLVFSMFLLTGSAYAAGSNARPGALPERSDSQSPAGSQVNVHESHGRRGLNCTIVDWLAHNTNAGVSKASIKKITGRIISFATFPGDTAPTANYDIYLYMYNEEGQRVDIAGAALNNRSATAGEMVRPAISSTVGDICIKHPISFELSGNSVNSAAGHLYIYWINDY